MIRAPKRLRAVNRNYRVAFEQMTAGKDGFGHPTQSKSWNEIGRAWAAIIYGGGDEQRAAAQEGAAQTATFDIRREALPTLSVQLRLRYPIDDADPAQSPIWDVHALSDIEPDGIAIVATKAAA